MKRITVNFTIRKMVKIITSILITVLMVGLCPHGSITVKAADISEITDTYPYIYWIPDDQCLILSKLQLDPNTMESSNGILIRNPSDGTWIQTETFDYYYLQLPSYTLGDCYRLFHNDVTGWEAEQPDSLRKALTSSTVYYSAYGTGDTGKTVYTNGFEVGSPFASGGPTLPSDIPSLDNVDDAINAALNATTSTTTQANTIQSTVNTNLDAFQSGTLSADQLQDVLDTSSAELDTLSESTSNTLADLIAINNAQNAINNAQNEITNQEIKDFQNSVSENFNSLFMLEDISLGVNIENFSDLSYMINIQATAAYESYIEGYDTKDKALGVGLMSHPDPDTMVFGLGSLQNALNQIIQNPQDYTEIGVYGDSDWQAIQTMQNTINHYTDLINQAGDLDKTVAESANASMESEMAFVDSLLAETTQSLEQLTPKLTDSESTQALQWVGMIWENKFFKMVLPWCGIAMLLCLVLGVKYKT